MNSKQFAWMYLFINGKANVKPNYYGGYKIVNFEETEQSGSRFDFDTEKLKIIKEKFFDKINTVGIDWNATFTPIEETYSEFVGTDEPSDNVKYIEGMLYLNDKSWQFWMAEPPSDNIFEMMANIEVYKTKFQELSLLKDIDLK
jgi:hypothetical protein